MLRSLTVVTVRRDPDTRQIRSFLEECACRHLERGQARVSLDSDESMVRVYWGGEEAGMVTAWAKPGERWNPEAIVRWMREVVSVELVWMVDGERVGKPQRMSWRAVADAARGIGRERAAR